MLVPFALQGWLGLNPNKARHLFIGDRMEHPEVQGPSNQAAAWAMGNSEVVWLKSYYPIYKRKMVSCCNPCLKQVK